MNDKKTVIIRPLEMKDICETAILCRREFGHRHTELVDFATSLSQVNDEKYYIALINNEIVGISGYTVEDHDPPYVAQISWTVVKNGFRRKNIGSSLLKTIEKDAKENKKRMIYVYTTRPNAERFYKKNNYEHGGTILNFYKSGKPKVWYYKHLSSPFHGLTKKNTEGGEHEMKDTEVVNIFKMCITHFKKDTTTLNQFIGYIQGTIQNQNTQTKEQKEG